MGDPAGQAAEGEEDGEHLLREAEGAVDEAGVEVDVGVEVALLEPGVGQGRRLQLQCDLAQRTRDAALADELGADGLGDARPRVVGLVDAVAEAHQAEAVGLFLRAAEDLRDGDFFADDALEHLDDGLVGAAVERAPEGADAGGDAGVEVGAGGADHADGGGGGVLLVVGVQDEEFVEDGDVLGGGGVARDRGLEHHVEEVLAVGVAVRGVDEGFADGFLVGEGGDGAQLGEEARDRDVDFLAVGVELDLGIEAGERDDHRGKDGHRVRAFGVVAEEVAHVLVEHRVLVEQVGEAAALLEGGQVAVDEEVGDFDERRVLREVLDGVAAEEQAAVRAVYVGDAAAADRRRSQRRIVRRNAQLAAEVADVDDALALRAGQHRQVQAAAVQFQAGGRGGGGRRGGRGRGGGLGLAGRLGLGGVGGFLGGVLLHGDLLRGVDTKRPRHSRDGVDLPVRAESRHGPEPCAAAPLSP